jgi:signal transduction histidine kinase
VAGDSNLTRPSSKPPVAPYAHDAEELWTWLYWLARARAPLALTISPLVYIIFRLRNLPYNHRALAVVLPICVAVGLASSAALRRYRVSLLANVRLLERIGVLSLSFDIVAFGIGAYFAGERGAWFRPFIFLPVVLGATLLPDVRPLSILSVFGIVVTLITSHPVGGSEIVARLLMCMALLGVSAFVAAAVARLLRRQRSERAELESMRRDKMLAEIISRRREEILFAVSHELASPLTTLRGYIRLLRESKGRDRANAHLIERIDRQAGRLASLASDLRAMSGSSDDASRLRKVTFDLIEALREVLDTARSEYPEAEVRLLGEAHLLGAWDRERLDQAFGNLVTNAFKFAGARARITVEVVRLSDRSVQISMFDDGPAIAPAALEHVFEPFQRYSAERGGLGLGLATARAAVEVHGGRIWVESPSDRGAVFHVMLPVDETVIEDTSAPGVALPLQAATKSP